MWFGKKPEEPKADPNAPPPWVGVDNVPKKPSIERIPFDLADFTVSVTGFKRWQAQALIFVTAILLGFIAYLYFINALAGNPLPKNAQRPAMDKYASSSSPI